ncbi:ArpU family phage packaging/lysis transcriptional regulator [Bacillus sp. FSL W7-1360]
MIELQNIDKRKTQQAVESLFDKYRLYKYVGFDKRSTQLVQVLSDMPRGGGTSDQTADVAMHNADAETLCKMFCDRIEQTVESLPEVEQFLIKHRYMSRDASYMTDLKMYTVVFDPPVSNKFYYKVRGEAFYKLSLMLLGNGEGNNKDEKIG